MANTTEPTDLALIAFALASQETGSTTALKGLEALSRLATWLDEQGLEISEGMSLDGISGLLEAQGSRIRLTAEGRKRYERLTTSQPA